MEKNSALLIIDVQKDFFQGGRLPVPNGESIIPTLNNYISFFQQNRLLIFYSRDWHPPQSKHFKKFGGKWPEHCIKGKEGAEFHKDLKIVKEGIIISKGIKQIEDAYSVFEGYDEKGEKFYEVLKKREITTLYVGGVATDFCVKASVIDGVKLGFKVKLLIDGIKGVDEKNSNLAIKEMYNLGVECIKIEELYEKK
jgi:nicotinamidase/pyrazinamidase